VKKAIVVDYSDYREQQQIWQILQSAGYEPRVMEVDL